MNVPGLTQILKTNIWLKYTVTSYWLKFIQILPKTIKDIVFNDKGNTKALVNFDHHIGIECKLLNLLLKTKT